MDFSVPLPRLDYDEHGVIRQDYKYSDDLINPRNWKEDVSDFAGRINEYIDQRDRFGDIRSRELREIGLPLGEARKTIDVFQTMSGDILNNNILINIGKTIEKQYEHYTPVAGTPISQNVTTSIIDVDRLPREISNYLIDTSSIGNSLSNGISLLVSPDKIEYNTKFIADNDYYGGRVVGENPDISKYGLYPEIVGTDVAKMTSSSTDMTSVAFTSGGLFGWKFVTPQQRTVGSAGDFGSIIIDILFKTLKTGDNDLGNSTEITDDSKNNVMFIFKKLKNYYDPLITSNVISDLANVNEDIGPNPSAIASDRNPVVIGVKQDEYRKPDIYALWCVHRSIRTPFYNREIIKDNEAGVNIPNLFGYTINKTTGFNIEFKPKPSTYSDDVKQLKDKILNALKGSSDKKTLSVLSVNISELVTEYNVPISETTSLANTSINKDIIDRLDKLGDQAWFNIISQAFTALYLSLFVAADTDWPDVILKTGIEGTNVPLPRLEYKVQGSPSPGNIETFNDKINLIKYANAEYNKYRNTLRSYLGINKNSTMGGTSLMGSNPISLQKYGSVISYPGDTNVLESISGYMTMFLSDINTVEERLQQSLNNMSNMYWYRDVLRWLEVLFNIFKPNDAPLGRSYSSTEIKARFFQLEKILKILYSKEIKLMIDYLQKSKILQRRYESSGKIDKSLEKQIKITSYYTRSTICYIKRQILIIYYLLDKSLESWWTISPNPAVRRRRAVAPAFLEADFKPAYRIMKSSLIEWFRGEVSRLTSSVTEPEMIKEVRTLGRDVCESDKSNRLVKKTTSNKYLQDEKISAIRADSRFWLLLVANLKNKDIADISSEIQNLQRLYIPVYIKEGSKRKYYLFDIMPLVLKGNYKGNFGRKSAPQWLTARDLAKTRFPNSNSGIVMIANTSNNVAYHNSWQAISVDWFDKLVSKSDDAAASSGDPDKKLWLIRTGLFILINDREIYNSSVLRKETLGSNDVDTTSGGVSQMRALLHLYQEYTNSNKQSNSKFLSLVSRDYIKNEMTSSAVQFHTI